MTEPAQHGSSLMGVAGAALEVALALVLECHARMGRPEDCVLCDNTLPGLLKGRAYRGGSMES